MKDWISKTGLAIMALALLLPWSTASAAELPKPTSAFYVNDYADVIDAADEAAMVANGSALAERNGAQVVLVTVDFVGDRSISDYAADLLNEWGVGDAVKNNGLVIVLSIGDDDYWAVQGRGLESTLPSGLISTLLYDYLETDFANKAYSAGAIKTYAEFVRQLGGSWDHATMDGTGNPVDPVDPVTGGDANSSADPEAAEDESDDTREILIVLVVVVISLIVLKERRSRRGSYGPYSSPYGRNYRPPGNRNGGGWYGGGGSGWGGGGSGWGSGGSRSGGNRGNSGSSGRSSSPFGGSNSGGGGSTRGGGAGRSGGMFGGGGSRPGGGGGGSRSGGFKGGGGSTRGGGAGRRK